MKKRFLIGCTMHILNVFVIKEVKICLYIKGKPILNAYSSSILCVAYSHFIFNDIFD